MAQLSEQEVAQLREQIGFDPKWVDADKPPKQCTVMLPIDGGHVRCPEKVRAKGMCQSHYSRHQRSGHPLKTANGKPARSHRRGHRSS